MAENNKPLINPIHYFLLLPNDPYIFHDNPLIPVLIRFYHCVEIVSTQSKLLQLCYVASIFLQVMALYNFPPFSVSVLINEI